jgi:uncharacterized membrane-anchored protein YitT (DUF2179 family)
MVGISFNWFFMPYHLVSGGLGGIALLLSQTLGWSTGLQLLIYNIPVLMVAQKYLGRQFLLFTILGIASLSVALAVLPVRTVIVGDPLLNAVFGGLISGAGVGLAMRAGGSTGGVDPILVALHRRFSLPMGDMMVVINAVIVAMAGLRGDMKAVLYTLIAMFVGGKAMDIITAGSVKKTVMIVTSQGAAVSQRIHAEMVRGVTVVDGRGAYSGVSRSVLLCVVTRYELSHIKQIVMAADADAFTAVLETESVTGRFRTYNPLVEGLKAGV